MEAQVENAIQIASDPTSSQQLRGQAIEYLNQLRAEGSAWQAALSLFTRDPRPSDFTGRAEHCIRQRYAHDPHTAIIHTR